MIIDLISDSPVVLDALAGVLSESERVVGLSPITTLPDRYRELSEQDKQFLREYGRLMNIATYGEEIGSMLNKGRDITICTP